MGYNGYDDDFYDAYDDGAADYDDDFGSLNRRRHRSTHYGDTAPRSRRSSDIIYGGGAVGHRNDDIRSHYTPRDDDRGETRAQARRRRVQETLHRRPTSGGSGSSTVAARPSKSSRTVKTAGSTVAFSAAALVLAMVVLAAVAVHRLYAGRIFADGGHDDAVIQTRLVTAEENQDRVTYFLIVGVDKSSLLTDCIWLMCFDNEAHCMNVMQIPRDTYVASDSPYPHKINAVYESPQTVQWCEKCHRAVAAEEIEKKKHTVCGKKVTQKTESNISALIRCVNTRLSLPVDHYVLFDFAGFEKVVDAMGGVDIVLDADMKVYPNKYEYEVLPAGENHLDGEMALKFMRNRQIYIDGDLGRVKAQRRIVHAMLDKVNGMSTGDMLSLVSAAYGNFSTDMSLADIRSFVSPLKKCGADGLNMFELPGEAHWVKPNPSYYVCDEEQTAALINEYLLPYSEKLTAEDIHFPLPNDG